MLDTAFSDDFIDIIWSNIFIIRIIIIIIELYKFQQYLWYGIKKYLFYRQ